MDKSIKARIKGNNLHGKVKLYIELTEADREELVLEKGLVPDGIIEVVVTNNAESETTRIQKQIDKELVKALIEKRGVE